MGLIRAPRSHLTLCLHRHRAPELTAFHDSIDSMVVSTEQGTLRGRLLFGQQGGHEGSQRKQPAPSAQEAVWFLPAGRCEMPHLRALPSAGETSWLGI